MPGENSHPPDALARPFSGEEARLKPHDRAPAALAHLLTLLPLWGVIFAAGVIYYYRESSRAVAFQARQAIFLHLAFLAVGVSGILIRLLAVLLDAAFPGAGLDMVASWFDDTKAIGLYIVFAFFPVVSAGLNSMGHGVVYPWIGGRLWEEPRQKEADGIYG